MQIIQRNSCEKYLFTVELGEVLPDTYQFAIVWDNNKIDRNMIRSWCKENITNSWYIDQNSILTTTWLYLESLEDLMLLKLSL